MRSKNTQYLSEDCLLLAQEIALSPALCYLQICESRHCLRSPSVEETGVYRQYLPSACVDIRPSPKTDVLVICPIAIAYSMRQIIKSFCVCLCVRVCVCVCVSVCGHSHGRISSSIFT